MRCDAVGEYHVLTYCSASLQTLSALGRQNWVMWASCLYLYKLSSSLSEAQGAEHLLASAQLLEWAIWQHEVGTVFKGSRGRQR